MNNYNTYIILLFHIYLLDFLQNQVKFIVTDPLQQIESLLWTYIVIMKKRWYATTDLLFWKYE